MNINTDIFFKRLKSVEYWEISDPLFNTVIAKKNENKDLNEALEDLQNVYSGQEVTIKAGNLDKNGNFTNKAVKINFTIPQQNNESANISIVGNNATPVNETITYNLNGVQQKINPENLTETLKGIEKNISSNLEAKFLKQSYELEYFWKFKELERREKELKEKEKVLKQKIEEYNDKLNGVLPKSKDIFNKVLDGVLFGFVDDKREKKTLNNTTEIKGITAPKMNFKIKNSNEKTDIERIKEQLNGLSDEELNEVFKDFTEYEESEESEESEAERNENKEIIDNN